MIPTECKRLAEVNFPIAAVGSAVVKREKRFPAPRGLPSTLHQWWARRPLASSRAVLMALLLPDPRDPHCPTAFKSGAREALRDMSERPCRWDAEIQTDDGLRQALLEFIARFSDWNNAAKPDYLKTARALVRSAHPEEMPLVVDPFAGGGSIPLEALRLGCDTFASDLNPVACLILKVMLEDIPRHGPGLADELRRAGAEIKSKAERELADLYPKDPDGKTPAAYLWARTVRCEAPDCGAEIPLMRSMLLCSKRNRRRALRPIITRPTQGPPQVTFEIFEPEDISEVGSGTVSRARATCPCCNAVMPPDRVRTQLAAQKGGADTTFDDQGNRTGGARMTAVVTIRPNERGRHYRTPNRTDYEAVHRAKQRIDAILDEWESGGSQGLCPVPDEPLPLEKESGRSSLRVLSYGMTTFGDLFSVRQKAAAISIARMIADLWNTRSSQHIAELMAVALDKVIDFNCSLASWRSTEDVRNVFGRPSLPIVWDFVETDICGATYVGLERAINHVLEVVNQTSSAIRNWGTVQQEDATKHPLPDQSAGVWFTDPPYYDAINYSDLSDFFLVWLKRALPNHPLLRDPYNLDNPLSPKTEEAIQYPARFVDGKPKDHRFYESSMARAFAEGRRVLREDGVGSVVFAHKTTAGWEALLSGMIRGGWTITGSWPITTESTTRLQARETAALATSVHLVCRPRREDAEVGEWADVLQELPARVGEWMERLQGAGVRGADLVFACVGPALEIYSRYRAVEKVDGQEVELREYLERVWETVARAALENVLGTAEARARNGGAGALEEDARLTALFLWTMQSTTESPALRPDTDDDDEDDAPRRSGGYSLPFDVARLFSQPLGIDLAAWESRIIRTEKGVVRLLPIRERTDRLFGQRGSDAIADEIEFAVSSPDQMPLPEEGSGSPSHARVRRESGAPVELEYTEHQTTLDQVHRAMLFQATGRSQALRALIDSERKRSPDFLRLANALSALYPRGSEEKRLLDAMLLAAR